MPNQVVSQVQWKTELSTRIFGPRKFRVPERYFGGSPWKRVWPRINTDTLDYW